jgi:ABC-type glycerol-3-phosphate transport system substrate-binding protein
MKKLLITALALSAGLSACGEKKADTAESGESTSQAENSGAPEAPKAELATFKVDGMS